MAITFGELLPEVTASANSAGIRSTSRIFLVPGQTPEDALANPSLNGAPPTGAQIGSLHPRNPSGQNLKCAGFQVGDRVGAGSDVGYYVTALYNPQGVSLGGPPPDVTNPLYRSESASTNTATIPYPIVTRRAMLSPVPQTGGVYVAPLKGFTFPVTWKELVVPIVNYQVTFNRQSWSAANLAVVASQTNTVHTFGGTQWCFEGAEVNEINESGLWTVTYRWYAEPPTPQSIWTPWWNGSTWAATDVIEIPTRAAFQRWEVNYQTLGVSTPPPGYDATALIIPFIQAINTKPVSATGFQSLPGWSASPGVPYTFNLS